MSRNSHSVPSVGYSSLRNQDIKLHLRINTYLLHMKDHNHILTLFRIIINTKYVSFISFVFFLPTVPILFPEIVLFILPSSVPSDFPMFLWTQYSLTFICQILLKLRVKQQLWSHFTFLGLSWTIQQPGTSTRWLSSDVRVRHRQFHNSNL